MQGHRSPHSHVVRPTWTFTATAQRGQGFEVMLLKPSCLPFLLLGIWHSPGSGAGTAVLVWPAQLLVALSKKL